MRRVFRIPVRLGTRRYEVLIGSGHFSGFGRRVRRLNLGTTPVVLSNSSILQRYGSSLKASLRRAGLSMQVLTVADSERSKSLRTLGRILDRLAGLDGPGRRLFLILAGGGVVGDLGGVAAGLYRRGIPFVQLPTTLLAQVDSAIGGKTGVDLPQGKNLVGLFYQPRLVFIEVEFLQTLSDRQFRSGLAEVLKCAVIRDPELFRFLERVEVQRLREDPRRLAWVVARAVQVKARVVESDELETRGIRTILNFGHTLGHAIETAAHYRRDYTHGEAVALGMRAATDMAWRLDLLAASVRTRIHKALDRLGLPSGIRGLRFSEILQAMEHDKKWAQGRGLWILPAGIGRCIVRRGVPVTVVQAAIRELWKGD